MNEEEALYILKEARINQKCKLVCPDNTEDCLDCENEAIQVILKLYEKQNSIIKNAIDYIQHNNKELKIHSIKHNLCNANIETLKKANIKRSIKIVYNGVKYNSIKEASRQTGVCEWSIKRKGKEVM